MFLFALKMYVADAKMCLRRFWWLAPISIMMMVIAPFIDDIMPPALGYMTGWIVILNIPRFTRIHFVVPLAEKQLKQIFLWRMVIACGIMVVAAAVFLGLCEWRNWSWSPRGLFCLVVCIALNLIFAEFGLQELGIKKKFRTGHIVTMFICIFTVFMVGVVIVDRAPLKWGMGLSYSMVILSIGYMFWYLRKVKIEDYRNVPFVSGE